MSEQIGEYSSLTDRNKELDKYATDSKIIFEIEKDYQDVLQVFKDDIDMEQFRQKYESFFLSCKESFDTENKWIKKCKENNQEIILYQAKVTTAAKLAQEDEENSNLYKQEIEKKNIWIEDLKNKEQELRTKISNTQQEFIELEDNQEQVLKTIEKENRDIVSLQQEDINKLQKINDQQVSVLQQLKEKSNVQQVIFNEIVEQNYKYMNEIQDLQKNLQQIKVEHEKEESNKRQMKRDLEDVKSLINETQEIQNRKSQQIKDNKEKKIDYINELNKKKEEKDSYHEQFRSKERERLACKQEKENYEKALYDLNEHIQQLNLESENQVLRLEEVKKQEVTSIKEQQFVFKKVNQILTEIQELQGKQQFLEQENKIWENNIEENKKRREMKIEVIQTTIQERVEQTKDLKEAEDKDFELDEQLMHKKNNVKKLENQIRGYQIEAQKMNKIITLLNAEQEKYGIEASFAHGKYYQTIEEVKIKNNIIAELQKKNKEVEEKLKHQHNLYEAVRSDRNLYSKTLLESQEEISELKRKYIRMTHQVKQLKEEIKVKNKNLLEWDQKCDIIKKNTETTTAEKERVEKNIKNTEEVIKELETHITKLKYIISEAINEKQRQIQDYEMVVHERDILGQQLIKRNQELSELYEKVKLAQSSLTKGEIFYREEQMNLQMYQNSLLSMRKELEATRQQTACISDLKHEINKLEKELLGEKSRVRSLQDEIVIKMNVHRWRKLEATDQNAFERILKYQTLQRRLIAKTEEVEDKEALIKEKEKLFMELKNILARQPGDQIHQQLIHYKSTLKDKVAQMHQMQKDLADAQQQHHLLGFEIQRLQQSVHAHKQSYYQSRQSQDKLNFINQNAKLDLQPVRYNHNQNNFDALQLAIS